MLRAAQGRYGVGLHEPPHDKPLSDRDPEDFSAPCGEHLASQLRREANGEKEEFGWHAFQALSICSVALGGIFYFMFARDGFPAVGLGALSILAFSLVTCRLGDSCYSSANRQYGYELFLYRVQSPEEETKGRWKPEYRTIEWEAAMRAWRVVQATLYEEIYHPGNYLTVDRPRSRFAGSRGAFWFCQLSLGKASGATFHAGSYLSRMHVMLLLAATAAVAILWITPIAVLFKPIMLNWDHADPNGADSILHWLGLSNATTLTRVIAYISVLIAVAATLVLVARVRAEAAKRKIMEDGLLSIHSCAIVWQAVVVAHFSAADRARTCGRNSWTLVSLSRELRAKHKREWKKWRSGQLRFEELYDLLPEDERGPRDVGTGIAGYSFWLAEEARSLARCAVDVPGWTGVGERELRRLGIV